MTGQDNIKLLAELMSLKRSYSDRNGKIGTWVNHDDYWKKHDEIIRKYKLKDADSQK